MKYLEYRVLRYISKHQPCPENDLKTKFGDHISVVLDSLYESDLVQRECRVTEWVIGFGGDFSLTDKGVVEAKDHRYHRFLKLCGAITSILAYVAGTVTDIIADLIIQAISK